MSKKKPLWSALNDANLKALVRNFQNISGDLRDHHEDMEKAVGDPALSISLDDIASLVVSIRNASVLLQTMISAKQIQELQAENEALRKAKA